MKNFFRVIVIALIILLAVSLLRDTIIKSLISFTATRITGTKVSMGGLSLGLLKQSVRIKDFKMFNPPGFPDGVLVDLPDIFVDCDLFSLLKGKLHLSRLEIDLKEVDLAKNKEGKLNVDSLKVVQQEEPKAAKKSQPAKPLAMQIDLVNLQLGKVVFKDYSAGIEPSVKVYDINLKKSYKNITSAQQLAALILSEPLKQAGIKGAAIYGVSALAGVAMLPVAIAATFIGKDSVQQDLNVEVNHLYDISLAVLKQTGMIKKDDRAAGVITAVAGQANITLKLKQKSAGSTQITISARQYFLPKPEIASGILYQISEKLK